MKTYFEAESIGKMFLGAHIHSPPGAPRSPSVRLDGN